MCTLCGKLEAADRSTDFWWPMGIRPLELRGLILETQAAFINNGVDEIVNAPRVEMAPEAWSPKTTPKWDWEPSMTMMRHVWTMEEDRLPSSYPVVVESGNSGVRRSGQRGRSCCIVVFGMNILPCGSG